MSLSHVMWLEKYVCIYIYIYDYLCVQSKVFKLYLIWMKPRREAKHQTARIFFCRATVHCLHLAACVELYIRNHRSPGYSVIDVCQLHNLLNVSRGQTCSKIGPCGYGSKIVKSQDYAQIRKGIKK